jgi:ribosome maturation factor RimP
MVERLAHLAPAPVNDLVASCLQPFDVDLDAVELVGSGSRRLLRVVLDRDGGVAVDTIAAVSRELSGALDRSDVMGDSRYTLEVTSRGVSRPLTLPRHWQRNAGRLVVATFADGSRGRGRIASADDDRVTLDDETQWAYADVTSAVIEPELKKLKER